jgi:hypothetical protein
MGRSIWRLTPSPRGKRPSIAALEPLGDDFRHECVCVMPALAALELQPEGKSRG